MQKILFTAAIIGFLVGCAPEAHDFADELGDNQDADAGSEQVGQASEDASSVDADGGVPGSSTDSAAQPGNDADGRAPGTDAGSTSQPDAGPSSVHADSGTVADGGSAQADSGSTQPPQPTVHWSKHHVATTNLGAVTTEAYHRARFTFSVNGCTINADSPFYPTGWTGSSTITLTSAQQACLRETFDCSTQAKVQWGSCSMAGCGSLAAGLIWEAQRPACMVSIPSGKVLALRVTIAHLAADSIDETWEVVTP